MTVSHNKLPHKTESELPQHPLLFDSYRLPLEQLVSNHYRREWKVEAFMDMAAYASHPAAILSGGNISVFVKLSEAANGWDQFEVELAGLKLLSDCAGVLVPKLVDLVRVNGSVIMVLEAVQAVERSAKHWRDIGRTLAHIHQHKGDRCGHDMQGYFGPLYQDNRPMQDWLTFYLERRLWPRFMGAIDSGNLPTETIRQVEQLIARVSHLSIPDAQPALLHGDAQQNNFISTENGAVVIDPAIYYGNPEIDLAYVDYFQDVPDDVFLGYQEILPIDPGFEERRDLWRISGYLAAVSVEGKLYLEMLTNAMQKYL